MDCISGMGDTSCVRKAEQDITTASLWAEEGWLRMADGSNLAKLVVPDASLPEHL